eukprot:gene242-114_t
MGGGAVCCLGCYGVVLIASLILFAVSFAIIEVNHVGLKFNSISRSYDKDTVYGPGRYFVGLGKTFEQFPTTWGMIDFCKGCTFPPVTAKAAQQGASPVPVHMSVRIFYRLRKERIPELIMTYPRKNWDSHYGTLAKNAIVDTIQGLTTDDAIQNRAWTAKAMGWNINEKLLPFFAYVESIFIGEVKLGEGHDGDSTVDISYLNQKIAARKQRTSETEGLTQQIRASTAEKVSFVKTSERKLISDTEKWGAFIYADYKARGDKTVLDAEGQGYLYLQSQLNFTQTDLLKFIYYDKISQQADSVVAGFPEAEKLLHTGGGSA